MSNELKVFCVSCIILVTIRVCQITCIMCPRVLHAYVLPLYFTCLWVLRACVPAWLCLSRACVPTCFFILRVYVPMCLCHLRAYVSTCLCLFHVQVPTCLGVPFYLTCLPAFAFYVPSCIRVIVFYVPPSLCVLFSCPKVKRCFTFAVNVKKLAEFHLNEFNKNFPIGSSAMLAWKSKCNFLQLHLDRGKIRAWFSTMLKACRILSKISNWFLIDLVLKYKTVQIWWNKQIQRVKEDHDHYFPKFFKPKYLLR